MDKEFKLFVNFLGQVRNYSEHTVKNYSADLRKFKIFCQQKNFKSWSDLTQHDVRDFISQVRRNGTSPRSLARLLSSLRSFYKFLRNEGLATIDPTAGINAPKLSSLLPKAMDADMVNRLLDFKPNSWGDFRDKAIAELLYSSGLRLSELCQLDMADISLENRICRVLGKGQKEREVPVGSLAINALKDWYTQRIEKLKTSEQAVFINKSGSRISARSVQNILKKMSEKMGVPNVNPHMLIHTFCL